MSLMESILERNTLIWDQCAATPFIRELQSGTLPFEKFKQYMIQDSIYLKHYARVYGQAIYRSTNLRDIQVYYSVLSFVTDKESAVRLDYLGQFGLTDDDIEGIAPLPENQSYIDFLLNIAEQGTICEMLMAVLPCMLSYSYIFSKVADEPGTVYSRYFDFIRDYADEQYADSCKFWHAYADEKCASLHTEEQDQCSRIFEKASCLELDFWKMAYKIKK